jgi:hypothetical protein
MIEYLIIKEITEKANYDWDMDQIYRMAYSAMLEKLEEKGVDTGSAVKEIGEAKGQTREKQEKVKQDLQAEIQRLQAERKANYAKRDKLINNEADRVRSYLQRMDDDSRFIQELLRPNMIEDLLLNRERLEHALEIASTASPVGDEWDRLHMKSILEELKDISDRITKGIVRKPGANLQFQKQLERYFQQPNLVDKLVKNPALLAKLKFYAAGFPRFQQIIAQAEQKLRATGT